MSLNADAPMMSISYNCWMAHHGRCRGLSKLVADSPSCTCQCHHEEKEKDDAK
jgi:hypothetical protein